MVQLNHIKENFQSRESEQDQQTSRYQYQIEQFKANMQDQEKENVALKKSVQFE